MIRDMEEGFCSSARPHDRHYTRIDAQQALHVQSKYDTLVCARNHISQVKVFLFWLPL